MEPRLVWPQRKYFSSYLEALVEHRNISSNPKHFQNEIENFPDSVLNNLRAEKARKVPRCTFWLVDTDGYIGTVQLRLVPQARFSCIASSVYYDIRPSKRRRGYGSRALALVSSKARTLGLNQLILTCDSTNLASKRIIQNAGGQLVGMETVPDREKPVLRFKLPL